MSELPDIQNKNPEGRVYEDSSPEQLLEKLQNDWQVDFDDFSKGELESLEKLARTLDNYNYHFASISILHWPESIRKEIVRILTYAEGNPAYINAALAVPYSGYSEQTADKLFNKFNGIIKAANSTETTAQQYYHGVAPQNLAELNELRHRLIDKAFDLLVKTEKTMNNLGWNNNVLMEQLEQINSEAILYANVFKNVSQSAQAKGEKVNFQDFVDTKFEIAEAHEITGEELKEMEEIYRHNYPTPPYPPKLREELVDNIIPANEMQGHFYLVKHVGKIIAFARFVNKFNQEGKLESIHFGAFNLNPEYGGGLIGEEMFKQFLKSESAFEVPIKADCDPTTAIAKKYIEQGFVGTGTYEFEGYPLLHIELRPHFEEIFETKKEIFSDNPLADSRRLLDKYPEGNVKTLVFLQGEQPNLSLCDQGFLLTRFFTEKSSGRTFAIFERKSSVEVSLKQAV